MNNENFHPTQKVPPLAHALHHWNEKTGLLRYEYNGKDILRVQIEPDAKPGFRHGSDGSMQSGQYIQQIYLATEKPVKAKIEICLGKDAMCMRPNRAKSEQAILGQLGKKLLHGVNGIYDPDWDLLLDWAGRPWSWEQTHIVDGTAYINVDLCEKAFYINLYPQYYRKHLGYDTFKPWERRPNQKAVAGWCSWEAYRRDIDQDKLNKITEFLKCKLRDYGLEYIQVDDGYQKMPLPYKADITMAEGWMTCDSEKFPDGHKGMVDCIKEARMSPAVWTNANITNPDFTKHFPDDVIWHEGKPLKGEWIDFLYSCTPECLERHVIPLFKNLKDAGYEYVKIDAIRHLLFDGLHECVRLGIMSNEEASERFRAYMEATRKGLGDDVYYLASWGEMHEVIGVADACRIAMDANPTWAGIRMQLFESARWFHSQRILFLNDPDHVCVRTNPEWAKSVLSLISLSGQLYMLSDPPEVYDAERLDIIRKTLPPLKTVTAETGHLRTEFPAYTWTKLHGFAVQSNENPVAAEEISAQEAENIAGIFPTMNDNHPFGSLWAFHLSNDDRDWCVAARTATVPLKASSLSMAQLGLTDKPVLVFDFWSQRFIGELSGEIPVPELELGHCQVLAIYEANGKPQIIGGNRHVSCGVVGLKKHIFVEDTLYIQVETGHIQQWFVHIPEGWEYSSVEGAHALCVNNGIWLTTEPETAQIVVKFKQEEA